MTLPTHRIIETGALVFPEGYDPAEIEALPDGYWEAAELSSAKAAKWAEIKAVREHRRIVVATEFGVFDADEIAKTNLLGKLKSFDLLAEQAPANVTWKLHDNTLATLTRAEFESACLQVLAGIEAAYETSFALEAQINAAVTIAEVEAIEWPAG